MPKHVMTEHDKSDYVKYRKKNDAKIGDILREVIKGGSLEMWDEWDVAAYEVKATRKIRNAQKHKSRLKSLKRYEA
jgi:hypothetical protein